MMWAKVKARRGRKARGAEVLIHYVGHATYTEKLFKLEAKLYGVSRAMPWNVAKKLRPGDKVLLAFWRAGEAKVFGVMTVDGYNLPHWARQEAGIHAECRGGTGTVHRGCGSYSVTAICYVKEDWDKVVEKLDKLYREKPFKVFVSGVFTEVEPPVVIENAPFTRGVVKVRIPKRVAQRILNTAAMARAEQRISYIKDYNQVKRRSKKEKEALLHKPLTEFAR